jgi:hypothetical protein
VVLARLPDGRVIIAGGTDGHGDPFAAIEVFEPLTRRWSILTKMREPRCRHAATSLPDGAVVFTGGLVAPPDSTEYSRARNGDLALTVETWDSAVSSWEPLASMPSPRFDHVAAHVGKGRILVAGGHLGEIRDDPASAEIWTPASGDVATPPITVMPVVAEPALHGPTLRIADDRIFVFGNFGEGLFWNPISSATEPAGFPKGMAMRAPLLVALDAPRGEILALEGKLAARRNAAGWRAVPPASKSYLGGERPGSAVDMSTLTALRSGGQVLVVGGYGPDFGSSGAELWKSADESWTILQPVRSRIHHRATPLSDGRVLVTGGEGELPKSALAARVSMRAPVGPTLAASEIFDPATASFRAVAPMKTARIAHAATLLADGRVLVTGGRPSGFGTSSDRTAEIWSPKTGAWTSVASMATARAGHTATLLTDGRVLVLGGDTNSEPSSAEIYDAARDAWSSAGKMPELWIGHTTVLLADGRLLVTTKQRPLLVTLRPPGSR